MDWPGDLGGFSDTPTCEFEVLSAGRFPNTENIPNATLMH